MPMLSWKARPCVEAGGGSMPKKLATLQPKPPLELISKRDALEPKSHTPYDDKLIRNPAGDKQTLDPKP